MFSGLELSADSEMMDPDWDNINMFPLTPEVVINSPAAAGVRIDRDPRKC